MFSDSRAWLTLTLFWCYIPFSSVDARLQHRPKHSNHMKRDSLSDSGLPSASWIWTPGETVGNVAFLKTFSSAAGKIATSATISLTAVNKFTLWVNGQPIGASNDWTSAQVLSAALNASTNTFSVLATNIANTGAPPPGLLAAVTVQYSDGSTDTVVSDSSWQASASVPSDFPTPADTSPFAPAAVAASFGSGAWGDSVTVSGADPIAPTLTGGMWIWSTSDAEYAAPASTFGFRKTAATPSGKTAQSATILLTADNTFTLYVNGIYVGAPPYEANAVTESTAWGRAQQVSVGLNAATNTFTVIVQNFLNPTTGATSPAGLVTAIQIVYADGSSGLVGTDPTWLNGAVTSASAFLAAADSTLAASFNVAAVNAWPWGTLSGISNLLAAADVPSSPFSGAAAPNGVGTQTVGDAGTTKAAVGAQPTGSGASATGNSFSGSFAASDLAAASTAPFGSGANPSTQTGSAADNVGLSSNRPAPTSPADGAAASASTHSDPTAAIIGAVVGTLALAIIGLAVFCWYRRHRGFQRRSRGSSITPFVPNEVNTKSEGVSVSRTSLVSVMRADADMAEQRLGGVNYSFPMSPAVVQELQRPASALPQSITVSPAVSPFTKLEWEHLMWSNDGTSSGGAHSDLDSSNAISRPSAAPGVSAPDVTRDASVIAHALEIVPERRSGSANSEPDNDDTVPPPSYYTE